MDITDRGERYRHWCPSGKGTTHFSEILAGRLIDHSAIRWNRVGFVHFAKNRLPYGQHHRSSAESGGRQLFFLLAHAFILHEDLLENEQSDPPGETIIPPQSILIVDDEPSSRKLIQAILRTFSHTVLVAKDGREALKILQQTTVDAIFMDCQMPEMDGIETTKAIRDQERHRGDHVPIIGLTASTEQEEIEAMLLAGMDSHISKPVTLEVIEHALARYLSGKNEFAS